VAGIVAGTCRTFSADGQEAQEHPMIALDHKQGFGKALRDLLLKIQNDFRKYDPAAHPISMFIAGGAALYLLTGARGTEDIDATFSRKVLFGKDIEISYRDIDGRAALVYLDRNYNDTLGLLHEDAEQDSIAITVEGIDNKILDARVLTPLDLAVSKLARFSDQDRDDITLLAQKHLIQANSLRARALNALEGYVGNIDSVRNTIEIACKIVNSINPD